MGSGKPGKISPLPPLCMKKLIIIPLFFLVGLVHAQTLDKMLEKDLSDFAYSTLDSLGVKHGLVLNDCCNADIKTKMIFWAGPKLSDYELYENLVLVDLFRDVHDQICFIKNEIGSNPSQVEVWVWVDRKFQIIKRRHVYKIKLEFKFN